ncbi:MAG: SUMF1/EgtB/PvdO family nonheme iron enzyme [Burkholderiales bacterium]
MPTLGVCAKPSSKGAGSIRRTSYWRSLTGPKRRDCGERVVRGGSWNNNPRNARAANRNRNDTTNRNNNVGFRLASTLERRSRHDQGRGGRAIECPGPVMMRTVASTPVQRRPARAPALAFEVGCGGGWCVVSVSARKALRRVQSTLAAQAASGESYNDSSRFKNDSPWTSSPSGVSIGLLNVRYALWPRLRVFLSIRRR